MISTPNDNGQMKNLVSPSEDLNKQKQMDIYEY